MVSDRGGCWGSLTASWQQRASHRDRQGSNPPHETASRVLLYIPIRVAVCRKIKPVENKQCTGCAETKPIEGFYRKTASRDGRSARCKVCANAAVKAWEKRNPDKLRERTYRWRERYPEKNQAIVRRSQLKKKYRITIEQYDAQLQAQGGVCAICKSADTRTRWNSFGVDHDHSCCPGSNSCGKCVRGLLCGNCNTLLGMADDNISTLLAAVAYLERGAHGFK